MKIQYFSDVHLEFATTKIFKRILDATQNPRAPVLVIAGDLGYPKSQRYRDIIDHLSPLYKKIFIIAGNHEYYTSSHAEIQEYLCKEFKKYPNISYLDNMIEDYEGYRFIGTTLWSHIENPIYIHNDFYQIRDLDVNAYNQLHQKALKFLDESINTAKIEKKPAIVITHHVPSSLFTDPKYDIPSTKKYQQCFSSSCEYLFIDPIKLWIFGHTHRPFFKKYLDIQFACHPIGYPGENNDTHFESTIEI